MHKSMGHSRTSIPRPNRLQTRGLRGHTICQIRDVQYLRATLSQLPQKLLLIELWPYTDGRLIEAENPPTGQKRRCCS